MKPFDLSRAQAGDPVYMEAQHTGWNYVGPAFFVGLSENKLPVVEFGDRPTRVSPEYLRMAPKKTTLYANIWRNSSEAVFHEESAQAEAAASFNGREHYRAIAVPVEIED